MSASVVPLPNGQDTFEGVEPESEFERRAIPLLLALDHAAREERTNHRRALEGILHKLDELEKLILGIDRKVDATLVCTGVSQAAAEEARDAARKVERLLSSVHLEGESDEDRHERLDRTTEPDLSANIGAASDEVSDEG